MSGYPTISDQIRQREGEQQMKKASKSKATGNPEGLINRHKAMAMGQKIETGAAEKPKAKKK